ncbi:MAG: MmcQ/YjbR family DNA-binding protein [Oscillospiraceae bacterium]|nr:MmcQ/YjbR family DNA-binding protein [Oscillospiraceae bacterium]
MDTSQREELIRYIRKKYKREIEFLWPRYPNYGIFRHEDNEKWFALVMDLPREKLGLAGQESEYIVNLKMESPLMADLLSQEEGIFPGYHISRGSWISVLLDGTVEIERIRSLVDLSYRVTASAREKKALRPAKEWLIPSNPQYFDIVHAFDEAKEINWKQGSGIKKGDIVFLYVGAPVSSILYKCRVTETDIPYRFSREGLSIRSLMRIRLLKRYAPGRFSFEKLKTHYGVGAVRGPRGIPEELSEDLKR